MRIVDVVIQQADWRLLMTNNELMYMNWQTMIAPEKVQVASTPYYGKFVCEPLERGYGITIGNSLRRILLNWLLILGCKLSATTLTKPDSSCSHCFSFPNTFLLTSITSTAGANRRSSSWHKYHLTGH